MKSWKIYFNILDLILWNDEETSLCDWCRSEWDVSDVSRRPDEEGRTSSPGSRLLRKASRLGRTLELWLENRSVKMSRWFFHDKNTDLSVIQLIETVYWSLKLLFFVYMYCNCRDWRVWRASARQHVPQPMDQLSEGGSGISRLHFWRSFQKTNSILSTKKRHCRLFEGYFYGKI